MIPFTCWKKLRGGRGPRLKRKQCEIQVLDFWEFRVQIFKFRPNNLKQGEKTKGKVNRGWEEFAALQAVSRTVCCHGTRDGSLPTPKGDSATFF